MSELVMMVGPEMTVKEAAEEIENLEHQGFRGLRLDIKNYAIFAEG